MSTRVKTGDVFVIPLAQGRLAVGQVHNVRGTAELFVLVFDGTCAAGQALALASTSPVVLQGLTLDALFHHKRWLVVGNAPLRKNLRLPTFRMAVAPGRFIEEDLDGRRVRDLPPGEVECLATRKIVAPIRIDRAAKVLLDSDGPWESIYDSLLVRPA